MLTKFIALLNPLKLSYYLQMFTHCWFPGRRTGRWSPRSCKGRQGRQPWTSSSKDDQLGRRRRTSSGVAWSWGSGVSCCTCWGCRWRGPKSREERPRQAAWGAPWCHDDEPCCGRGRALTLTRGQPGLCTLPTESLWTTRSTSEHKHHNHTNSHPIRKYKQLGQM